MRWWLSQTFVKWWKQIGILGWIRFRILRFAYKIFWINSPRNGEWDFVLQWMRPLRQWQQPVVVLDVGCTESLLLYELQHRGYSVLGIDQRAYQEPNNQTFVHDIMEESTYDNEYYDYIVAISTVEHIGLGAYGDVKNEQGDRKAMMNLFRMLRPNGYLIITVPNKHLGTQTGRGYSYYDFKKLISGYYEIAHYEERSNQICAVLVKCR